VVAEYRLSQMDPRRQREIAETLARQEFMQRVKRGH